MIHIWMITISILYVLDCLIVDPPTELGNFAVCILYPCICGSYCDCPAHLCLPCISGNVRLVRCLRVVGVPILVFEAESDISTDTGGRMAPVITWSDVKRRCCGQTRLTSRKLWSMPDEWFPSIQDVFFCCKLLQMKHADWFVGHMCA